MHSSAVEQFSHALAAYYKHSGRHDLPWRIAEVDGSFDPYKILVSELMLQQTQVVRVIPKFNDFISKFPTISRLAQATLGEVLIMWSGLGYNRRAKFLHQAAQKVVQDFGGVFPATLPELVSLPGVGKNTAGAIAAYAFNMPVVFIETNVRTVYIHHFFHDQTSIPDTAILEYVRQTLDQANPRVFYWSLMDYGSYLKQTVGNLNKRSTSYVKQSPLQGSRRQIRGMVIKLVASQPYSFQQLQETIVDERLQSVLNDLVREQLIAKTRELYHVD